jgi:hypothetical protein
VTIFMEVDSHHRVGMDVQGANLIGAVKKCAAHGEVGLPSYDASPMRMAINPRGTCEF